jgi:hypothetical protein
MTLFWIGKAVKGAPYSGDFAPKCLISPGSNRGRNRERRKAIRCTRAKKKKKKEIKHLPSLFSASASLT